MKYYDENDNEITNPDLTKGSITIHTRVIGSHDELMPGTNGYGIDGKGLYQHFIDSEEYGVYHVYTTAELEEIKKEKFNDNLAYQVKLTQLSVCELYSEIASIST